LLDLLERVSAGLGVAPGIHTALRDIVGENGCPADPPPPD
jgi:hypothetical protein